MTNTNSKKVYSDIGLWEARSGNGYTAFITEDVLTRLKRIVELAEKNEGGSLYVGPIKEEYQRDNGPTYRFDYIAPKAEKAQQAEAEGV